MSLFCRAALHRGECNRTLPSAAVHLCCVTAHLSGQQSSLGVIAVTQTSCEPILQSSTEQWGIQFALPSVAVHGCCVTAHLYEEQIFIGVIAETQTSCEPVLQSSTAQRGMQSDPAQCCSAFVLCHCTPVWTAKLLRCNCSDPSQL